ncbi:sigma factor-like helix-turn-helix DNA-binding protein [Peribacillus aracenensis]|uniref:sigma factor-like helix-turn-helix DNA-binding protein n=1 Tax=Peribacillus aracenensis TaxID=2976708 RepID=UPI0021A546EB|nr:sigma factor-like helix-turn-helix DNA-binding protein [Peribacillus sp. BBB004]
MDSHEYVETNNVEELLKQYEKSLADTKKTLKNLEEEIQIYSVIYEDKDTEENVKAWAREMAAPFLEDKEVVASWKRNLEYCMTWMKTGHRPGLKRGIERRAAYQNEKPVDPLLMQRYFRSSTNPYDWDQEEKEYVITPTEQIILNEALAVLSEKEREVYILSRGNGHSQYKVAEMMNLSRSSIKTMLSRADKKIASIMRKYKEGES